MQARETKAAKRRGRSGGFILLEAMVATAIFAMAVLALARCIEAGLQAGIAQRDDARARRALAGSWKRARSRMRTSKMEWNSKANSAG